MTDLHLPSGWTWITPADVAANERHALAIGPFGSNLKVSDYKDSGVPLVFVRNIRTSNFGGNDGPCVSPAKAEELQAHLISGNDILITKMGDPPGDSTVYPTRCPPAVITADCIKWRVDPLRATPWFFAYAIRTHAARQQIATMTKGVAQKKISLERFRAMRLPMAPLREQKAIVAAIESHFSRLDAATATLERVLRNLERYRASVLKAAVEGRLVPTEAELAKKEGRSYEPASVLLKRILAERRRRWEEAELAKLKAKGKPPTDDRWKSRYEEPAAPDTAGLPELPEGWSWTRIDTAGRVQLGRQRSPEHHAGSHMRPYLRVANVFEDRIDTSDVMSMNFSPEEFETYRLRFGDILLNEGQSPHLVGRPAMYRDEVPGACFTNSLVRFQAAAGVEPRFALIVFLAQLHMRRYMRIAQITTNIAHLGAARFAAIEFPLPPLDEQRRIADEVERLLSTAGSAWVGIKNELVRVTRLRQSILKWAFEGRLTQMTGSVEALTRGAQPEC